MIKQSDCNICRKVDVSSEHGIWKELTITNVTIAIGLDEESWNHICSDCTAKILDFTGNLEDESYDKEQYD